MINEQYSQYARYPPIPNSYGYFYPPTFGPSFTGSGLLRSQLPPPISPVPMHPMPMYPMFPNSFYQMSSDPPMQANSMQNSSMPANPVQSLPVPANPVHNLSVLANPVQNLSVKAESSVTPPLSQRKPKRTVPDEEKDDKYRAKRCKNNDAAKKSRETRRKRDEENVNVLKSFKEKIEQVKKERIYYEHSNIQLRTAINEIRVSMNIRNLSMATANPLDNYPPMTSSNN